MHSKQTEGWDMPQLIGKLGTLCCMIWLTEDVRGFKMRAEKLVEKEAFWGYSTLKTTYGSAKNHWRLGEYSGEMLFCVFNISLSAVSSGLVQYQGEKPANLLRLFYIFIILQIFPALFFVGCCFLGGQPSCWWSKAQSSDSFLFWLELNFFMVVFEVQLGEDVWLNKFFAGKHTEITKPICRCTKLVSWVRDRECENIKMLS